MLGAVPNTLCVLSHVTISTILFILDSEGGSEYACVGSFTPPWFFPLCLIAPLPAILMCFLHAAHHKTIIYLFILDCLLIYYIFFCNI